MPDGVTDVEAQNINCSTSGGGSTECGEDFTFNPDTRKLSGTIKRIDYQGKVIFSIPGKSVDYSSSWSSAGEVHPSNGFIERIPSTNFSNQGFSVEGFDPFISKSVDKHLA